MIRRLAPLPLLALLAACAAEPPAPVAAQRPEEAFRAQCRQQLPNASDFGMEKCMADAYDRSRGLTPASATPAPAAATAATPSRSSTPSRNSGTPARRAR
ncbi:hypothetical protein ACE7GA_11650 [Roseomonas sp. CCTCC AB2023176]|uniref:hypothetical protein n=1 Tax=Roseomonas sp. CCTCC AB2023176 TaxID=3342640 RepID=UPI0035DFD6F3